MDGNTPPYAPPVVVAWQGAGDPPGDINPLPVASPVVENVFMGKLLNTLVFSSGKLRVFADDSYDVVDNIFNGN